MFPGDLDELRALAQSPFASELCSPFGAAHYVVLGETLIRQVHAAPDRDAIVDRLGALPCPVIGVADKADAAEIWDGCDTVVSTASDLSLVLANIDRAPLAAMTLVQLLRATATIPIGPALTLESLAYATLQAGPEHRAWLDTRRAVESADAEPGRPPVRLERDGARLRIVLDRPERRNALSVEMRDALSEALQLVVADPTIERATISGAGRCFSIGGDLDEFGRAPDPATAHAVRSVRLPAVFLAQCADRVEFRLHGACLGAGIELPAFARRVVAARNSFFQLPELRFGLIPGAGGCVSLARRIGRHRTACLVLSGRRIGAATALAWGLVDEIVGP